MLVSTIHSGSWTKPTKEVNWVSVCVRNIDFLTIIGRQIYRLQPVRVCGTTNTLLLKELWNNFMTMAYYD